MKITLTNVPVYCTASKIANSKWRITSAEPPGIMFVRKKYVQAVDKV